MEVILEDKAWISLREGTLAEKGLVLQSFRQCPRKIL